MNKLFKRPFVSSLLILKATTMNEPTVLILKTKLLLNSIKWYNNFQVQEKKGCAFRANDKVHSDQGLTLETSDFKLNLLGLTTYQIC